MTRDNLSSITVVDGLRGFLKLPVRSDEAEHFRSMTVKRNRVLFLSLPAKARDELRQREDYTAAGNELLKQRRVLERKELDRIRSTPDRTRPEEREGEGKHHVDHERSLFDRLRHMMPERERLSHTLFRVSPLRSPEGISAVKDLLSLLTSNCRVAYQPVTPAAVGQMPSATLRSGPRTDVYRS